MKTNDILLYGGIGLALYLLSKKSSATPLQQAGSDLGSALNKIFSPQYSPGATTPAARATVGASAADYISASSKVIDSIGNLFKNNGSSSVTGPGVIGPGESISLPIAYDLPGNPTAYSALSEKKKPVAKPATLATRGGTAVDNYFAKYRFY